MKLRIPDSEKPRLTKLLSLSEGAIEELRAGIEASSPKLRPEALIKELEGKVKLESSTLGDVVRLLLSLYWLRTDNDLEPKDFARDFVAAVQSVGDDKLNPPGLDWTKFEGQLTALLSLDRSLGVTSKALFIAYQFPRHFHGVRIMTDARPIFSKAPSDSPAAFIIAHTLKIDFHENGKDHEWFATLDSRDLEALKEAVDRALTKEKSLKQVLDKTQVPTLDWEE